MTLKERIEEYCKYAKIRISAFERRAGLSNGILISKKGAEPI